MSANDHENSRAASTPAPAPAHGAAPTTDLDADIAPVARLKEQAARDLRRQKQLAIAVAGALGAFLLLVYFPSVATLAQLNEQLNSDARRLQDDQERSRVLPEMRMTAERLERDLAGFKPFPASAPLDALISETMQLGLQFQLRDLRWEPRPEVVEGPLGVLPVRLVFEGNFENVYSFIRRCEQMAQPVRIQELHMKQKPAQQAGSAPAAGEVTVELLLNVYFQAPATAP
jgi:Tfp pilus assembly protein PilO